MGKSISVKTNCQPMLTDTQKRLLSVQPDHNIAILCLAEEYPMLEVIQEKEMLMCRFLSEEEWCHFSYNSSLSFIHEFFIQNQGPQFIVISDDDIFARVQEEYRIDWSISCYRLFQDIATTSAIPAGLEPLRPEFLSCVFENSKYQQFLNKEYLAKRLELGGGYCVMRESKPVAWVMTHDDGSVGMLHILDTYRRQGLAKKLVEAMSWRVRQSGRPVFAHIEPVNEPSLRLFYSLDFELRGKISWARVLGRK